MSRDGSVCQRDGRECAAIESDRARLRGEVERKDAALRRAHENGCHASNCSWQEGDECNCGWGKAQAAIELALSAAGDGCRALTAEEVATVHTGIVHAMKREHPEPTASCDGCAAVHRALAFLRGGDRG